MHLAVDAVGIKHSGGAVVLLDFLAIANLDERVSAITVFCSPTNVRRFELPRTAKISASEQARAEHHYLDRILWQQSLLGRHCREVGANVLLCMTGAGNAPAGLPHVTFVQQALPFAPEFAAVSTAQERVRMATIKRLMRSSCRSACRVIVQSPTMRDWTAAQLGLPRGQIEVVLPAVSALSAVPAGGEPLPGAGPGRRLLYVGSENRYKNVDVVLRGLAQVRAAVPEAELYLTWPQNHPAGQAPGVHCLGYLSREQLARAYGEAHLLVMPSLIETVGLPILEAMQAGVPVLAADRPYAHDIAEDAAVFFDPLSPADFAGHAVELLENGDLRSALIGKGLALAARRTQEQPYPRMLDIVLGCAQTKHPTEV